MGSSRYGAILVKATLQEKYQVGDLVEFASPAVFANVRNEYANPGIILEVKEASGVLQTQSTYSYIVRWNDGRTTTEWFGYLKRLNK